MLAPALNAGDQLVLLIDGKPIGSPKTSGNRVVDPGQGNPVDYQEFNFSIDGIYRGYSCLICPSFEAKS